MNITPQTEEEVQKGKLAPTGDYAIEILEAIDKTSSKGNDMIELKIGIYEAERIRWQCFDYLLDIFPAKLRHCCDTLGILDKYQAGTISAKDFSGRTGHAKIVITEDKKNQYPVKNTVKDYICRSAKPLNNQPKKDSNNINSTDLPF